MPANALANSASKPPSFLPKPGVSINTRASRAIRTTTPSGICPTSTTRRGDDSARVSYRASVAPDLAATIADGQVPSIEELTAGLGEALIAARASEIERGQCLVGPHRDDVLLTLGELPAKGYASHGESWSFALGLKLAAYELLRTDLGTDPVLVLDDVFAELDSGRRSRLAGLIGDCEQVLITAAVPQDIPASLVGQRLRVAEGAIGPQEPEGTPDE